MDHRLKPSFYPGGATSNGNIVVQINLCPVVDFALEIFLAQSSLRKSLIYWLLISTNYFEKLGSAYWIWLSLNWIKFEATL